MSRFPIVVLDTCSAFNLSKINIDDKPALLYLIKNSNIRISKIVWNEYANKFKPIDEEMRELYSSLRDCEVKDNITNCFDFIREKTRKDHLSIHKHKGEIDAAALTLWLSRTTSELIILVTDEFDIYNPLDTIIHEQFAGGVFTSFDLILFLFTRLPTFSKFDIEDLLRDLERQFSKPSKKDEPSKAELKLLKSLNKLREICKYEKCSHKICYQRPS